MFSVRDRIKNIIHPTQRQNCILKCDLFIINIFKLLKVLFVHVETLKTHIIYSNVLIYKYAEAKDELFDNVLAYTI